MLNVSEELQLAKPNRYLVRFIHDAVIRPPLNEVFAQLNQMERHPIQSKFIDYINNSNAINVIYISNEQKYSFPFP